MSFAALDDNLLKTVLHDLSNHITVVYNAVQMHEMDISSAEESISLLAVSSERMLYEIRLIKVIISNASSSQNVFSCLRDYLNNVWGEGALKYDSDLTSLSATMARMIAAFFYASRKNSMSLCIQDSGVKMSFSTPHTTAKQKWMEYFYALAEEEKYLIDIKQAEFIDISYPKNT